MLMRSWWDKRWSISVSVRLSLNSKYKYIKQTSSESNKDRTLSKWFLADVVKKQLLSTSFIFYIKHEGVFFDVSLSSILKRSRTGVFVGDESIQLVISCRKKQIVKSGLLLRVGFMFVYPECDGAEVKASSRPRKDAEHLLIAAAASYFSKLFTGFTSQQETLPFSASLSGSGPSTLNSSQKRWTPQPHATEDKKCFHTWKREVSLCSCCLQLIWLSHLL